MRTQTRTTTSKQSTLDKLETDAEMQTSAPTTIQAPHMSTAPQHSNIILVRGARTENGQIILQNSHELLSLLNDEDKPILLQHQRIKTKNGPDSAILFQPTIKTATTMESPIILQTQAIKKNVIGAASESTGSIFLQQRFSKAGGSDGPILLQTLKRLDKTQPILVFRSASSTATTTATTTSIKAQQQQLQLQLQQQQHLQINIKSDDGDEMSESQPQKQHGNIPLGTGEYCLQCYVF